MTSEPWLGYSDDEPATAGDGSGATGLASGLRSETARSKQADPLAARQPTLVDFVPAEFQLN
ncbi:hypothetical protein [Arthrobacter sp. CAL618]|uniref:hypothetical protein n=1 Tax=Arthrobacter sp. CAL618 TaxID=1055770 RepID=UPI00040F2F64|nr:hypothetical protein [Arthrobacter sp. CAL618]